jgi:hypothetical protein
MSNVVQNSLNQTHFRGIYRYASGSDPFSTWIWDGSEPLLTSDWKNKEWVRTPGYRTMDRKHLPMNPFTTGSHTWRAQVIERRHEWHRKSDGFRTWCTEARASSESSVVVGPHASDGPLDYPEVNAAIADLQKNVSASAGSLAVSGAEIHKTLNMVGNTALKLVKAKKALLTGRFGLFCETLGLAKSRKVTARGKKFSKDFKLAKKHDREDRAYSQNLIDLAANTWLEFTYGWKPLVKDVYDQMENLSTLLTRNEGEVFTAIGQAKNISIRETVWEDSDTAKITKNIRWVTRTRFKVVYGLSDLSYRNVFGLNNPALVAWEVVPFSFVVDWFLPIGSFIEGLTAYNGVAFKKGTRAQFNVYDAVATGIATGKKIDQGAEVYTMSMDGSDFGRCTSRGYTRAVLSELPHQTFPEVFKDAASLSHATSALALLHQVFKQPSHLTRAVYR